MQDKRPSVHKDRGQVSSGSAHLGGVEESTLAGLLP